MILRSREVTCRLAVILARRDFGEGVLSIFLRKIMAATFYFSGSRRLGRERNLYQGGGRRSKLRRGVGVGVGE